MIGMSACTANQRTDVSLTRDAVPAAPPDAAVVVIYRVSTVVGDGPSPPTILVNSLATCDARSGGAFAHVVRAGEVTVSAADPLAFGTSRVTWVAEAGKTYYVRVKTSDKVWASVFGGFIGMAVAEAVSPRSGPFELDLTDEETALANQLKVETCGK